MFEGSLREYADKNNLDYTLLLSLLRQLDFERYQPTMLVVEHDTRFRDKVSTHIVEM